VTFGIMAGNHAELLNILQIVGTPKASCAAQMAKTPAKQKGRSWICRVQRISALMIPFDPASAGRLFARRQEDSPGDSMYSFNFSNHP